MWTTDQLGLAAWHVGHTSWQFDVRGGEFGIGMLASKLARPDALSVDERYVSLLPVDGNPLPLASEQYVRGDCYFINYPQGDGNYALRLALKPIETHRNTVTVEASISIQTDLLDSHPMLDLATEGKSVESYDQEGKQSSDCDSVATQKTGSPSITVVHGETASTAILLGPHDSPFTSNHSSARKLSLRLFGDFLEKGVIRTARPWIVVDHSGEPILVERLIQLRRQLCESPLPLSS